MKLLDLYLKTKGYENRVGFLTSHGTDYKDVSYYSTSVILGQLGPSLKRTPWTCKYDKFKSPRPQNP